MAGPPLATPYTMLFRSWDGILRVVVVTSIVFIFIVAVLRVVGPQALAKMSPFDMVFTVTLGSLVATIAVTRDITASEGAAAIITLLVLQEAVRFIQSRNLKAHHLVRQPPRVLLWEGTLLDDRLKSNNISADEVRSAVRKAGLPSLKDAQIVVLENDGEWSVIPREREGSDRSALFGLPIPGMPDNSPKKEGDEATLASPRRLP